MKKNRLLLRNKKKLFELLVGIDWGFNAYGGPEEGCYWPCTKDEQIASNICNILNIKCDSSLRPRRHLDLDMNADDTDSIPKNFILEGGSIHTDGQGTIVTTKECLLNPNRNPTMNQEQIEIILQMYLGATKIIWLPYGLHNDDDTNGHVDNFVCFGPNPAEIILAWTDHENENEKGNEDDGDDNDDDNNKDNNNNSKEINDYERCRIAYDILSNTTDAQGRKFKIHKLHVPTPSIYYTKEESESLMGSNRMENEKCAASYVNFYIANAAIIVPQFGNIKYDTMAINKLTEIFSPNRKVVGVYSREILLGGGNIHCITQQIPTKKR